MQTNFTPEQLADSHTAASEAILRKCVHCGFCTATCPTYLTLGDELDSPRGRIYLIKDMLEAGRPADERTVKHIDRCLSCLACMTTCPSGVHYMHLVDHARAHIEQTYTRPPAERALREALIRILPYPARFRAALTAAWAAKPFAALASFLPKGEALEAMLKLAPNRLPKPTGEAATGTHPARAARRGRVAILSGCAQSVLDPGINEATVRLLTRVGIEVVVPKGEGCCGALVHHMGREAAALDFAKANIAVWEREIAGGGLDAILVTTSGCGTTIKDYGWMLRDDPAWAERAARVSGLAKDITEYLVTLDLPESTAGRGIRLAYHSACSMQHGQRVIEPPKRLLRRAGFTVVDVPEGHICCGSAGTYNMLQPEIAGRLRERKRANIARIKPDLIAAGNIGCITQIGGPDGGEAVAPIVHTAILLDWAHGGPRPAALGRLGEGQAAAADPLHAPQAHGAGPPSPAVAPGRAPH